MSQSNPYLFKYTDNQVSNQEKTDLDTGTASGQPKGMWLDNAF